MSLQDGWMGLTHLTEGGWHFGIIRESEAVDWYTIPESCTRALAMLLKVDLPSGPESPLTGSECDLIAVAWDDLDWKTLEMLQSAGLETTVTGVWIPGGDFGYNYKVGDDGESRLGEHN